MITKKEVSCLVKAKSEIFSEIDRREIPGATPRLERERKKVQREEHRKTRPLPHSLYRVSPYTRSRGSTRTHRARKHNLTCFNTQSKHITEGSWIKGWNHATEASYSWVGNPVIVGVCDHYGLCTWRLTWDSCIGGSSPCRLEQSLLYCSRRN